MSSSSGSRDQENLSIRKHHGTVTQLKIRRVETASMGSMPMSPLGPEPRPGTGIDALDQQPAQEPPPSRRGRKGMTVHWPFQSIVTDNMSVFTSQAPELYRRATWQPPKLDTNSAISPRDSTLIPDYVVNFIRGETPESVARRKRNGGNQGMRAVDITHQHKPQQSHMAMMEGISENHARAVSHLSSSGTSTMTELQQILPSTSEKRKSGWTRLTTGWRSGVALNILLTLVILIAGFICLVIAGIKVAVRVGDMDLFTGSCRTANNINWGLHALINVAVVVLIVGANYVFQVLSSPTRSEISGTHDGRKWLEIGVPSVRNFRHIGSVRVLLASLLLAVAVVTQVIYNSIIFTTEAGLSYNIVAVTESFLSGAPFSNASSTNEAGLSRDQILELQGLATRGQLTNLSTSDCVDFFTGAFNTEFQNVLLVTNSGNSDNSLIDTAQSGIDPGSNLGMTSVDDGQVFFDNSQVETCLAERSDPSQETCTVKLNGILFAATLLLNLVTLIMTAITLVLYRFEPLVTLGDAVSSFLRDPDPPTRKNCLLTKENLTSGMGGWGFSEGKYWTPKRDHRWFRSPSLASWLAAGFWWLAATVLAAGVLVLTIASQPDGSLSAFGVPSPHTTYLLPSSASTTRNFNMSSAAALAVVAALPQVLAAGLYFSTNALLTSYFLSRESSLYAVLDRNHRLPLRVSADPEGYQTTSLYLTLPRPLSWVLAIWFATMGFVLSQACFVVVLSSPSNSTSSSLLGVGFSGVALAVLLAMLVILGAVVVSMGLIKAPATVMADGRAVGNPLVLEGGSCSAVISARCHRVPGETDVWKQKVAWGVVPEAAEAAMSHATYSARPLAELDAHRRYA